MKIKKIWSVGGARGTPFGSAIKGMTLIPCNYRNIVCVSEQSGNLCLLIPFSYQIKTTGDVVVDSFVQTSIRD